MVSPESRTHVRLLTSRALPHAHLTKVQAPKTTTQPAKLSAILAYFHKSGVAHSIKDLEKALPFVASINGMQVKDYLQALSDENKIKVEKIGSGNWYWAFAGEEMVQKGQGRDRAEEERDKARATVEELRAKVDQAVKERSEGDDGDDGDGEDDFVDRKTATERLDVVKATVETLRRELLGYSGSDPVELEKRKGAVGDYRGKAEKWTEHVWAMEGYLRDELCMGREELESLKMMLYGDDYVEEEGGLVEI